VATSAAASAARSPAATREPAIPTAALNTKIPLASARAAATAVRIRSPPSTAPGALRRPAELVWCRARSYANRREPGGVLSTLELACEASIRPIRLHPADLLGLARLASEATARASDVVETVHHDILRAPWPRRGSSTRRTGGIAGLVYRSVRGIAGLVTGALDAGWRAAAPRLRARESSPAREALLAAVNGVLGDHLAFTGNPLALPMSLRTGGRDLEATPAALARAFGTAQGRLVVLVHGLCRNDRHWLRRGHDHGAALARDLGVVPIYVRYNSGLHVSENGRALADLLEALCAAWPAPLEELALVAHSMGGLVARSACHYGRLAHQAWVGALRRIVFLGTPHHGAPLERGGHGLETLLGRANVLQSYNHYLGDPDRLTWDLDRYRTTTAEKVRAAAAKHLQLDRMVTVITIPTGAPGGRP